MRLTGGVLCYCYQYFTVVITLIRCQTGNLEAGTGGEDVREVLLAVWASLVTVQS